MNARHIPMTSLATTPPSREPDLLAYPDACLFAGLSLVELRLAIADGLISVRALRTGGRTVRMVERRSLEAWVARARGPNTSRAGSVRPGL